MLVYSVEYGMDLITNIIVWKYGSLYIVTSSFRKASFHAGLLICILNIQLIGVVREYMDLQLKRLL